MKADCYIGQITATDLADYLVERGMPFREAHETVGKIVSTAEMKGLQIHELELTELKGFSKLIGEEIENYLDPEKSVFARNQTGGTSPKQVKRAIKKARKLLENRK